MFKKFSKGERVVLQRTDAPFYQKNDEAVIISAKYSKAEGEVVYLAIFENRQEWFIKESDCKKVEIIS